MRLRWAELRGDGAGAWPRALRDALPLALLAMASVVAALATASVAEAVPMRFLFEGTVTTASGVWTGEGTTVTGFYEYDTDALDIVEQNAGHDAFAPDMPGVNESLPFEISVTVGNVTRTTATNQRAVGDRHHLVQVFDRPTDDAFSFVGFRQTLNDDFAAISLLDRADGPVDPDGIEEQSFNLQDQLMTDALEVALFDDASGVYVAWHDDVVCIEGTLQFDIERIELVPEPSTALLFGLGLVPLAARRRGARA